MLTGNYTLPNGTMLNLSFDQRRTPLLATSNAIIGQNVDSVGELLDKMSEKDVRRLALDRTATMRYYLFGITQPINEQFQISGDITVSEMTSTPGSGGVEAMPGTGREYFYNLQLIGNNLFREGDMSTFGLRYANASSYDAFSVILRTLYPYTQDFRITPGVMATFQKNTNHENWLKIRPTLRFDYRWAKQLYWFLDMGAEWDKNQTNQSESTTEYFGTIGYRWDF